MDLLGSIVAANPCPPLPLQVTRKDAHTGRDIVGFANTHHVLMQAYVHAMNRDCVEDNSQREKTQIELTRVLQLAFSDPSKSPEQLYNSCTTFTRAYLHAFMPKRDVMDARFPPFDDIACDSSKNNNIIRCACEHLAGLIYYDEGGSRTYEEILSPLKDMQYSRILSKYAEVHTARLIDTPTITEIMEEPDAGTTRDVDTPTKSEIIEQPGVYTTPHDISPPTLHEKARGSHYTTY